MNYLWKRMPSWPTVGCAALIGVATLDSFTALVFVPPDISDCNAESVHRSVVLHVASFSSRYKYAPDISCVGALCLHLESTGQIMKKGTCC